MSKTHFPLAGGNQWAGALRFYDFGKPVGNVFFVNSATGSDTTGFGYSPEAPVATLDYAIGLCTASNHDHVMVMPGHSETYTTTGAKVTFDVAGVTVVGLGAGASRPTFTFSHTGATWVWSAAGVTLKNVLLVTGVDSVTTFCTISGADATLEDIETRDTTDVETVDTFITTAAADRLTVRRHFHNGYTSGNANARVWKLVGCDRPLFEDCRWITKVTTAVVNFVSTACTGVEIKSCLFSVDSTTNFSKDVVDTVTGSTWAVTGNSFDLGAGAYFGGGSGAALAGVSVSSITDALYDTNGIVTFPAAAVPGNGVSIAEVLRDVWDAVRNGTGGTEPGSNKSVIDAIGFDGAAAVTSTAGMLRTAAGTSFPLQVNVTSSAIPNNTQTSGAFTGAASGAIVIEDIIMETDATGLAGPTNVVISVDNVSGLTGVSAPLVQESTAALGANATIVCHTTGAVKILPFTLESGKKLYIAGDDAGGSGAGVVRMTVMCRRVADGGSLAAGGIGS